MAFEWLVKLNDAFSDPATRVERSIRKVTASLRDLQAQQKENSALDSYLKGNQLKGDLMMRQAELLSLRNKKAALKDTSSALAGMTDRMKEARRWTRDWVLILNPLVQGLNFVAGKAEAFGKTIGEAIIGRQDARIGFQAAFGNNAEKMLQMTQDLATRTGRPVGELFHEAMNFGNLGAPEDQIRPMLLAISDAKAMGLEFTKLNRVFEASLSKPVGTLRDISEGLRGVVDETKLWVHLAEDVGKVMGRKINVGEVGQLFNEHRIGGGFVRQAVLETIQDREQGKLGLTQFKRADQTLGGTIDKFEQRLNNIFANVERTQGFKTFHNAFKNILSVITEKKTQDLINNLANSLGRALEPLTGPEGKKRMENFFERLIELAKKATPVVTAFGDAIDYLTRRFAPTDKDRREAAKRDEDASKVIKRSNPAASSINTYLHEKFPNFFGLPDKSPFASLPEEKPQGYFVGGRQVSKEEFFGLPEGKKKTEELEKKLETERAKDREAIINALQNVPSAAARFMTTPIHFEQHIDARGATEKDAKAIAKAAKDATVEGLADAFDRMNAEAP